MNLMNMSVFELIESCTNMADVIGIVDTVQHRQDAIENLCKNGVMKYEDGFEVILEVDRAFEKKTKEIKQLMLN